MANRLFGIDRDENGDLILRFKSPQSLGMSSAAVEHLLAAQHEVLLAVRSMLDHAIETTEDLERSRQKKKVPRTEIEVQ